MVAQNVLRQITVILYRLKRQYGLELKYLQYVSQTQNVDTGDISRVYTTITIRRACMLPDRLDRSFVYDLTFIAANNNFVGGGYFNRKTRLIIIDAKDLPNGFKPNDDDHIEFDDARYEILVITALEQKKGYLFRVQAVDSGTTV